jgi:hypothetical protein
MPGTRATSTHQLRLNLSDKSAPFLAFLKPLHVLHDERFHMGNFLVKPRREIVRPVLEQHDKAKRQNDEQSEPEKAA